MLNAMLFSLVLFSGYLFTGVQFLPRLLAIVSAAVFALTGLVFLLRSDRAKAKGYALQALAFAAAFFLMHGFFRLENNLASSGAVKIAGYYDAYKTKTGKYPETPAALGPDYVKRFPSARHTFMWSSYRVQGNKIMFVIEPGLMAKAYDIAAKEWSFVPMEEMFPNKN